MPGESQLQRELRETWVLTEWVRNQLFSLDAGGRRADATNAIAAAAAERAYRLTDEMPEWTNDTSETWRIHLGQVWDSLAGDRIQHYALSTAIAAFLTSPLNHNEGQDGPDDFDRPQTIASYSAALAVVAWGVDFAVTSVMQVFECLDLKYSGEFTPVREADFGHAVDDIRDVVKRVLAAAASKESRFTPELLEAIRR